ncbi:LptA/OstA family protein [Helicobacter ibis]|uniref:Lipopolysaccharide transport periplasmic protein LptA n=1 Tax=Helicobacter ibis TaxID=2962633 RepID=A0ABT4VEY4_9HELI|nr:LptA/OstA family protein [Helicobacter ibis]MDA3969162.1 lipopolysaccharide transport periplasmic protein LptA [Helicobacter ibis]
MKYLIFVLFILCALRADKIEVSAKEFIGSSKDRITKLKGNVEVKRANDVLNSKEAFIYLDSNNKPTKMRAIGDVKFAIALQDNRKFSGSANEVIYLPNKKEYQLLGNVVVVENGKSNSIKGDKILVSHEAGYINVLGDEDKPAKLIFKLDKKEQ